jgi:DNA primase
MTGLPTKTARRHNQGKTVLRNPTNRPAGEGGQAAQHDATNARIHALLRDAAAHYRATLRASPEARRYLRQRGIGGAVAARFGLGYARPAWRDLRGVLRAYDDETAMACGLLMVHDAPAGGRRFDRFRGRVMFPIRDRAGALAGFGGRVLDGTEPKYLNSPEGATFRKRELLYGLCEAQAAIQAAGLAVVVEGYFDVVSLAQAGFAASVGTLGTACAAAQVALLLSVTSNVVFCFDGDAAGRRAAAKALQTVLPLASADRSIRFMFLPPEHDPDSFVRAHGIEAFRARLDAAVSLSDFLIELVSAGCEMHYAEGRSRCSFLARPYWQALPAGAIKHALRDYCAGILKFSAEEIEALWQS